MDTDLNKLTKEELTALDVSVKDILSKIHEEEAKVLRENAKTAQDEIDTLVGQAAGLISDAEKLADKYGSEVNLSWNLSYGMGGWYSSGEWQSSSQSC